MGKGRPRVPGHCHTGSSLSSVNVPLAPVFYPTEDEFKDPLGFVEKIRPEAEPYGICRIVPPINWNPPFALDLNSFTFPTKCQEIHRLQARTPACDPKTFYLGYNEFLEKFCGKKSRRKVIFDGAELDFCKLFNAVKRYGGYQKVVNEKKWGSVYRFVCPESKISECSKHVLCQLYREHLYDYEEYQRGLSNGISVKKNEGYRRKSKKLQSGITEMVKEEDNGDGLDQICEQCKSGVHGEVMLLCDRCNKGWHLYCLSPPLERVPDGNWYCLDCLNSEKDAFGFVPGKHYSLESFKNLSARVKRKCFGSLPTSPAQLEKRFWEIVDGLWGEMEVMYGSDLDTSIYGSGFPRMDDRVTSPVDIERWKEYSLSPWNLNNLPKLPGSMLREVHNNIAGVMVPWLYIGMLFSSFCWHFEDHCFYSMNYLHWGDPKCWYSVPGGSASDFEKVMKNNLPDLFDAQPDLLFQLITMLNPSVLQENGVPVYSVLQEPGNFVITFPRSYHGGFNFGFNCAEAVNFAPPDWLPHGGFGSELYRLYRKPAVLSHEELLCVVAKKGYDAKTMPFLMEELRRIFGKEKTLREKLWISGVVRTSRMAPLEHPEYVGTEEGATCIICQQYVYLSAVVCKCNSSSFVCVEHWEHFCECDPEKHRLLYRYTLSELSDLLFVNNTMDLTKWSLGESSSMLGKNHIFCHSDSSNILMKKVNGTSVCFDKLANDWLLHADRIRQRPFTNAAYTNALKETEQFLWSGHEVDSVRHMVKNLVEAQKWALNVRACLSKIENHSKTESEKVSLSDLKYLLRFDPVPCNEPNYLKLKGYADEAGVVVDEIKSLFSHNSSTTITMIESLHSRVVEFPVHADEFNLLLEQMNLAKVWVQNVKGCLLEKETVGICVDVLYDLRSKMEELLVSLKEMVLLEDLLAQVQSWRIQCKKILEEPISLKQLDEFLCKLDSFSISFPELSLLRKYRIEALSWVDHCRDFLQVLQQQEDQKQVSVELTCLLNSGRLLKVQVDELSLVDLELKRAICREKAFKVFSTQVSMEFIQDLIAEAILLQIDKEKIFVDVLNLLTQALCWEDKARSLIHRKAQMSEYEDLMRTSKKLLVFLPSLHDVEDTLLMANSWLKECQPFLMCASNRNHDSRFLLSVDTLKGLLNKAKLLKISLTESERLQSILNRVEAWEHDAQSLLVKADMLFNSPCMESNLDFGISVRIKELQQKIDFLMEIGSSLGFDFIEVPKLQKVSSRLGWILQTLSLCLSSPLIEEVDSLLSEVNFPPTSRHSLEEVLLDGAKWLRKSLSIVAEPCRFKRFNLEEIIEVIAQAKAIKVTFPFMIARLMDYVERHKSWKEKVHSFFDPKSGKQSWSLLLQLKELGDTHAFNCSELDMIRFECEKISEWLKRCNEIMSPAESSLKNALLKVDETLDRALCLFRKSKPLSSSGVILCCSDSSMDENYLICLICKDRYHFSCIGCHVANIGVCGESICPFCLYVKEGMASRVKGYPLISKGSKPDVDALIDLLHDAKYFYSRIEEKHLVLGIVEKSLRLKSFVNRAIHYSLSSNAEDLTFVSQKLLIAFKSVSVAGVYDYRASSHIERVLIQNSWKIRIKNMLQSSKKPTMQEAEQVLKEGLSINISCKDHFIMKLGRLNFIGMSWTCRASMIMNKSEVELDEVLKLIKEGEDLPIVFENEIKLLKAQSMLHCICRRPHDGRSMIACAKCDEWYHLDCINLCTPAPSAFVCHACSPLMEETSSMHQEERLSCNGEPQTPPLFYSGSMRRRSGKSWSSLYQKMLIDDSQPNQNLQCCSEIDILWRKNRRISNRRGNKRRKFHNLTPFSLFER